MFWDCWIHYLFESRVAINPGLGGVRDIVSAIISHEQTRVCRFQLLDAVFPKDLLIRYFKRCPKEKQMGPKLTLSLLINVYFNPASPLYSQNLYTLGL